MAGKLQIAITGTQDQWLTGAPEISYFVTNHKRHTRFSTEAVEMPFDGKCDFSSSVECKIPQNVGDLMRSTMLKIKLGNLSTDTSTEKYRYNTPAALSIIKHVDLVIGGQIIERLTGDYIYMYNQLYNNKDDVNQSLYFLSGHGEHLQVSDSYNTFYVNIPFYFFRNPSLAVPVCAITKQLVEVRVTFKDVNDDVTFKYTIDGSVTKRDKTTEGSIDNVSLITDFYFVAEDERNFLLTRPMEYIISQLQMSKLLYKPNESKKSALLKFKHPVKELFFSAKEKTGITNVSEPVYAISQPVATINAQGGSVISNNGLVAVTYDNSSTGEVNIYEKDSSGNWPSTASATYTGSSSSEYLGRVLGVSDDGTRVALQSSTKMIIVEKQSGVWTQIGSDITAPFTAITGSCLTGDGTKVFGSLASPANWTQLGADIDGQSAADQSGYSVSMSSDGTRMAVGAIMPPQSGGIPGGTGKVRVYEWDNVSWSQLGADINGEGVEDYFGNSVSISPDGTRVAIGAQFNNPTNTAAGDRVGHVRVYEWDNVSWSQVGGDIDGEAVGDQSGYSVSMSSDGTRVAIGALFNDGTAFNAGHVRVYEYDATYGWNKIGNDIDGEGYGDRSGRSVSLSSDGTRVAIGAYINNPTNNGAGVNIGHVRVYSESSGAWSQLGGDIDGEARDDLSGWSVSISGDGTRVAIGAPYNDPSTGNNAGHVRVYDWDNVSWSQVGQDIDGESGGDQFGNAVSLSSDGTHLAIGAPYNDPSTGDNAGHVRVYVYNSVTPAWEQIGPDIDGEALDDLSGYSLSMSSDGTRVAISSPFNDENGISAGHVRVYSLSAPTTPAVSSWEYSGSSWSQYRPDITVNTAISRISHSTNGEILGLEDATKTVIHATTGSASTYTKRHADTQYSERYHSLSSDGANLVSLETLGSKVWNQTNYVYDGAAGTQVPWYTTSASSMVEISRNGNFVFWNDSSSNTFKLYSKSVVDGNVQWTLETSLAYTYSPVKMSPLGGDAIIVTGSGSVGAKIHDITATSGGTEDRLLNISSSDQEFTTLLPGKRSDHRLIKNVKFACNGETIFDQSGQYLAYEQSLRHHTGCPDPAYEFYTYSFSLQPEMYYPTGQLNMSRIIHKKIDIELEETSTTRDIDVSVYALNYNILHVESGLAGLKF